MPASARLRRCPAPVVSPIAQTSIGTGSFPRRAARAAIAVVSAAPDGACTTRTAPTSGAAAADVARSASRSDASGATWTISSSASAPCRAVGSCARRSPSRSAASAAIPPALIALVTIAKASPRPRRARARVSAAASKSSRRVTQSTPARLSAASNARSAPPLGSESRVPGRIATTGRSRDAARAAERNARRFFKCLMSSRIAPVPASRDSQSSTRPKPISALPPMPTMWLNPTPFGWAQSRTARHKAADCDTNPSRPAGGGRCAREAFSPIAGTDDAERTWPQHAHAAPAHRIRKAFGHADHHRCKCALRCQRRQGHGHRAGWRREHRQVRSFREGREVRAVIGIQLEDLALEPARLQICQHLPALGRAATDHRDGTGMEQPSGAEAARGPEGQKGHGGHSISPCAGPRSTGRPSLRRRACDGVAWVLNGQEWRSATGHAHRQFLRGRTAIMRGRGKGARK